MKKYLLIFSILTVFLCGITISADNLNKPVNTALDEVIKESNKEDIEYFTRSEFLSTLMKSMGYTKDLYVCSFNDIYETSWDYVYIANAENRMIARGTSEGSFYPEKLITKQEALAFLSRAYKINEKAYENTVSLPFDVDDYAKGYISYAIINGIYTLDDNSSSPKSYLTKQEGIDFILNYANLDEEKLEEIKFSYGYPKVVESGKNNYISILVKTNKPCTIYYMINETSTNQGVLVPDKQNISNYLGNTSIAEREVKLSIEAKHNKRYNIYLVAVDKDGVRSRVYTIKNTSSLPFTQGNGTNEDPYKIYTSYQLEQVRFYPDSSFMLCSDIAYNDEWEPIGDYNNPSTQFKGIFDGNGHSITGLRIEGEDGVGLFSCLYGGIIKNLSVEAQVVGESFVGIIAGVNESGTIEECQVTGSVKASENAAGGIVGKNNGRVKNSLSLAYIVNSTAYSGGVAGTNYFEILNCFSGVSSVYSDMYASGISGANISGVIKNCVAANGEATDTLTQNSGRITTNRENGVTKNNYAYENMVSGLNTYIGKDFQDGAEISWSDITNENIYIEHLKWDFEDVWTFDKDANFMVPILKNTEYPKMTSGITIYYPMAITNEDELKNISKNLSYHYILKNDITIKDTENAKSNWTPIGIAKDSDYFLEDAFCGSLDGNGKAVKNIKILFDEEKGQYGMFGCLYGATVRNLTIENAKIEGHSDVAILTSINYGTIENCKVSGAISAYSYDKGTSVGTIASKNYANIYNCDARVRIDVNAVSTTVGGVVAENEGFIDNCSYQGNITSTSQKPQTNSIIGKIVGSNYSGMIYNSSALGEIYATSYINYCGGIVGIMNGGEVYKCSSSGKVTVISKNDDKSLGYIGGICALNSSGLIMNSFSQDNIYSSTNSAYAGGILGYAENAYLQNTYSVNTINQRGKIYETDEENVYAGGILGYSVNSNMSGNVAINPYILTNGKKASQAAFFEGGYADNNYSYDRICQDDDKRDTSILGIPYPINKLKDYTFYTKPIELGGKLGWISFEYSAEDIWIKSNSLNYPFPILMNVKNQSNFKLTEEYR